jgi:hypothetical protein
MAQVIVQMNWRARLLPPKPEVKQCRGKCGKVKKIDDFGREIQARDGKKNFCKECENEKTRERQQAKRAEREYFSIA